MKMSFRYQKALVFDVQSVGMHGDGYAVGWVIINNKGEELSSGIYACPLVKAKGTEESREWTKKYVPGFEVTHANPKLLRDAFWKLWKDFRKNDEHILVADCCWPEKSNFMSACISDNHERREWEGPHPIHDVASVCLAVGRDPLMVRARYPKELPVHHPTCDARQSARFFIESQQLLAG